MWGNTSQDSFLFSSIETGNIDLGLADTIKEFTLQDQSQLDKFYVFVPDDPTRDDGQYSIWMRLGKFILTWNDPEDTSFHDVTVEGSDSTGRVGFFGDDFISPA